MSKQRKNRRAKKKYPPWYKKANKKHITGFLSADDKAKLQKIARDADKSLSRYVTRLLEEDIRRHELQRLQALDKERTDGHSFDGKMR